MAQISVRLDGDVLEEVNLRGFEVAPIVRHAVKCYLALMDEARPGLRNQFTEAELRAIYLACRHGNYNEFTIRLLPHGLKEVMRTKKLVDHPNVDGDTLFDKLISLDLLQLYVLMDVMDQYHTSWVASEDRDRYGRPMPVFESGEISSLF